VQDAACRAFHERKVGTTVRALITGTSRKDATMLAGKTTDNVTVIVPTIEQTPTPALPWVDVRVEHAFVWGVKGTVLRRAERWTSAGAAVTVAPRPRPVIDVIGPFSVAQGGALR
jgi:hypothetical protein